MDGIDVGFLETDGQKAVKPGAFETYPYTKAFRAKLRAALGKTKAPALEKELTELHAKAVKAFIKKHKLKDIDALGFHGHTIFHAPAKKQTVQIGDGKLLAKLTGIPVVYDFRTDDVKAGGQGAPLVPVYHQALAAKWVKPAVFVNIGGVANITFIGKKNELSACDTGPGNAMMDDWAFQHIKKPYDKGGKLAAQGVVDSAWIRKFLAHPYFKKKAPKSLDRDAFKAFTPTHLNAADGAATLAAMTVLSLIAAINPLKPSLVVVAGGGRHNTHLMRLLKATSLAQVLPVEKKNLNGDATEAQAFAYMAVREILGLPISFKTTTGRK